MTPTRTPSPSRRGRLYLAAGLLLVTAAAVLAFVLLRPAGPPPPEVPRATLEPAVAGILDRVRDRVVKAPRSAQAWGELGEAFFANDLDEQSRVCFARAEALDPGEPRWPYFQGGSLVNRGDAEAALPYLERAVARCEPRREPDTAPRLWLAETLLALGRLDEAETQVRRVLARQPDDPRVHFDLGTLAVAHQDWPAARDELLRCQASPFAQKKASAQLAVVYRRLGDEASAERSAAQARRLPPDADWTDPFATEALAWAARKKDRYRLAENLEKAGRLAEAADVLRPLVEQYPDDYLPLMTLGKVLGARGDYGRAEPLLRAALRLAPDRVQPHYYLSLILLKEGEQLAGAGQEPRARACFQESADLARQALAVTPDYGLAHMCLGVSLKHLGRQDQALAALREAVRCNPEAPEFHYDLSEALAEAGQKAEARQHLQRALDLAPPDAPWRPAARAWLDKMGPEGPPTPGP
jgi:tetratricopeptide (TPR) repeat protein